MNVLFVASEEEIRAWIKEAVMDAIKTGNQTHPSENDEPLLSRKEIAEVLDISLVTLFIG